jgi:hypothetical protein
MSSFGKKWSKLTSIGRVVREVERDRKQSGTVVLETLAAGTTSYSVSGMPEGSLQWFSIEARNAAGSAQTAWTVAEFMPQWSTDSLAVSVTSVTEATLTWADAEDETDYVISRWSPESGTVVLDTVAAETTSCSVTGMPGGTLQWFSVTAQNAAGGVQSAWQVADLAEFLS